MRRAEQVVHRRRSPASLPEDGGFTMLETLIALTILGISVSVLFGIFSDGIERSLQNRDHMRARVLAQGLIATAAAFPPRTSMGGVSSGFQWWLKVTAHPADIRGGLEPEQIDVRVRWNSGEYERSTTLGTLVLAPEEKER